MTPFSQEYEDIHRSKWLACNWKVSDIIGLSFSPAPTPEMTLNCSPLILEKKPHRQAMSLKTKRSAHSCERKMATSGRISFNSKNTEEMFLPSYDYVRENFQTLHRWLSASESPHCAPKLLLWSDFRHRNSQGDLIGWSRPIMLSQHHSILFQVLP